MGVSYEVRLTEQAMSNLRDLDIQKQEQLEDAIMESAGMREPSNHQKCRVLKNDKDAKLYKIRVGDYRAICQLEKPKFYVHQLDHRKNIYDDIEDLYANL